MPIYEYRCGACGGLSSFFLKSINGDLDPRCSNCDSSDMVRRMSSFAMGKTVRSEHEQHSAHSGPRSLDYYSDPRNIGRNVEASFARYGMEMPDSVRQNIDAAREGELPKSMDA